MVLEIVLEMDMEMDVGLRVLVVKGLGYEYEVRVSSRRGKISNQIKANHMGD